MFFLYKFESDVVFMQFDKILIELRVVDYFTFRKIEKNSIQTFGTILIKTNKSPYDISTSIYKFQSKAQEYPSSKISPLSCCATIKSSAAQ